MFSVVLTVGFLLIFFRNLASSDWVALFQISFEPLQGYSCASTQGREALMTLIVSPRRSLRTGFDPRSGTRDKYGVFARSFSEGRVSRVMVPDMMTCCTSPLIPKENLWKRRSCFRTITLFIFTITMQPKRMRTEPTVTKRRDGFEGDLSSGSFLRKEYNRTDAM